MERIENIVRLALTPGLGCVSVNRLLNHFGTADRIFGANDQDLLEVEGIQHKHIAFVREAAHADPQPEIECAADNGVELIHINDSRYPEGLRSIYDPPFLLYVKGELQQRDAIGIGIVGTRRASHYGREQSERFGNALSRAGYTITSGLARGVDTFAHRGALNAGGRTIAVLGSGMCHLYPEENRDLAAEITASGAVVTEFSMRTRPGKDTFPRRNRIIAGLSLGILVVEAPERSGAMITARLAMETGRDVFAIPGRIDHANSAGCHMLLRDGAVLVRNLDDILEELQPSQVQTEIFASEAIAPAPEVNDTEKKILDVISSEPAHIDEICAQAELPIAKTSAGLMVLEMKRLVKQQPGKFFVRA